MRDMFEHVIHRDQIKRAIRKTDLGKRGRMDMESCLARDADGTFGQFNACDLPSSLPGHGQFRSDRAADVQEAALLRDSFEKPFGSPSKKILLPELVIRISCRILYAPAQYGGARNWIYIVKATLAASDDLMFGITDERTVLGHSAGMARNEFSFIHLKSKRTYSGEPDAIQPGAPGDASHNSSRCQPMKEGSDHSRRGR
jgi:hypothetical protein